MVRTDVIKGFVATLSLSLSTAVAAAPTLLVPESGALVVVADSAADLDRIDGLAFDAFGNLFGTLESDTAQGGVVYIDKNTGTVTKLVSGILRADQIALHPDGSFYVTSETRPPSTRRRLYRISVRYGSGNVPVSATARTLITTTAIDNPEGLAVIAQDGPFGPAGHLLVGEDRTNGRVLRVSTAGVVTTLVGADAELQRPEGFALGALAGTGRIGLYVAQTDDNSVLSVEPNGVVGVLGNPGAVGLQEPDNLAIGPDGALYVAEDRKPGRLMRIGPGGAHSVLAVGLPYPQGLAFDPDTGHLFIAVQDRKEPKVYRLELNDAMRPPDTHDSTGYDSKLPTHPTAQP